uniref:Small ribosomal subunit protein mS39 n=2 Tax=Acrobeloides nanus TaxID=290746 RepID=A0A914CTJ8_9BILA
MYRTKNLARYFCTSSAKIKIGPQEFEIPYEIKRSPTDLLKALSAATLKEPDKSAPHFAFIDDPRFIPQSAKQAKEFYITKEYGKRAARHLAMEWPTLFMWDYDEPRIEAFRPIKPLDINEAETNEKNLAELIKTKRVIDAFKMFDGLDKSAKGMRNIDLMTNLFALCAYYNSQDKPITEMDEWHGTRNFMPNLNKNEWQAGQLADHLFDRLEKTEETYSIMISALVKYKEVNRARTLYQEMRSLNMIPREEAYNALVVHSNFNDVIELLKEMNHLGVKPSIATIHACLCSIEYGLKVAAKGKQIAPENAEERIKQVGAFMSEMKRLNLTPTLTTFHLILSCLDQNSCTVLIAANKITKQKQKAVDALNHMLTHLESLNSIEVFADTDRQFFVKALNVAINANNVSLVERIEKLYSSVKNNVKLVPILPGDYELQFITEHQFYQNFLMYKIHACHLSEAGHLYMACVPRYFDVSRRTVNAIFKRIVEYQQTNKDKKVSSYWTLLKRVIDDYQLSGYILYRDSTSTNRLLRTALRQVKTKELSRKDLLDYHKYIKRMIAIFRGQSVSKDKEHRIPMEPSTLIEIALIYMNAGLYNSGAQCITDLTSFMVSNDEHSQKKDSERKSRGSRGISLTGDIPSEEQLEDLFNFILKYKPINKSDIRRFMRLINMYHNSLVDKYRAKIEAAFPNIKKEELDKMTLELDKVKI